MKRLLDEAKRRLPELKALLADISSHWGYEDSIYRFYHQSFKVYRVQTMTQKIVAELQALSSRQPRAAQAPAATARR